MPFSYTIQSKVETESTEFVSRKQQEEDPVLSLSFTTYGLKGTMRYSTRFLNNDDKGEP